MTEKKEQERADWLSQFKFTRAGSYTLNQDGTEERREWALDNGELKELDMGKKKGGRKC